MESDWVDITSLCWNVANSLTDERPMLHHDSFSLEGCMSASEIMEPKMDPYYGVEGPIVVETIMTPPLPSTFDDASLLALLQSLMIQEAAFLGGASLVECTHQCVFLWEGAWESIVSPHHDPNTLPIRTWLLAFVESSARAFHHIGKSVIDADIYEDEDFHAAHISLGDNLSDDFVESLLTSTILEIQSSNCDHKAGLELMFKLRQALFRLYMKYHQAIENSIRNFRIGDLDERKYIDNKQQIATLSSELRSINQEVRSIVHNISQYFIVNESTKESGLSRDFSDPLSIPEIQFAYNGVISRLQTLGPTRTIKLLSFRDSIMYIDKVASELVDVCGEIQRVITDNLDHPFDSEGFLMYSLTLSEMKRHLLTRSLFFITMHIHHLDPLIFLGSMRNRGIPLSFLQRATKMSPTFFEALSMVYWDTIKTFSCHRNRVLPKLDGILASWGALVFESNTLDIEVRMSMEIMDEKQQWFVYWILIISSQLMDQQLNLMLEYGLLSETEYDCFFHYCDYVCTYRTIYVEKLRELHFIFNRSVYYDALETEMQTQRELKLQKLCKGKKTVKAMKELNSNDGNLQAEAMSSLVKRGIAPPEPSKPSLAEIYLRARSNLCRGIVIMLTCYTNIHAIKKDDNHHMSLRTRFMHRFRAFQGIPNPSYLKYDDVIKPLAEGEYHLDPVELLSKANQCFQVAKKLVDELRKGSATSIEEKYYQNAAVNMMKAIITNSINCMKSSQFIASYRTSDDPNNELLAKNEVNYIIFKKDKTEEAVIKYEFPKTLSAVFDRSTLGYLAASLILK